MKKGAGRGDGGHRPGLLPQPPPAQAGQRTTPAARSHRNAHCHRPPLRSRAPPPLPSAAVRKGREARVDRGWIAGGARPWDPAALQPRSPAAPHGRRVSAGHGGRKMAAGPSRASTAGLPGPPASAGSRTRPGSRFRGGRQGRPHPGVHQRPTAPSPSSSRRRPPRRERPRSPARRGEASKRSHSPTGQQACAAEPHGGPESAAESSSCPHTHNSSQPLDN